MEGGAIGVFTTILREQTCAVVAGHVCASNKKVVGSFPQKKSERKR